MPRPLLESCIKVPVHTFVKSRDRKEVHYGTFPNTNIKWRLGCKDFVWTLVVKTDRGSKAIDIVPARCRSGLNGHLIRHFAVYNNRRFRDIFVHPPTSIVGVRPELQELRFRYGSQQQWTEKSQRLWRRGKALSKYFGSMPDPKWLEAHQDWIPNKKPKWWKQVAWRRLLKSLGVVVTEDKDNPWVAEIANVWGTRNVQTILKKSGGSVVAWTKKWLEQIRQDRKEMEE